MLRLMPRLRILHLTGILQNLAYPQCITMLINQVTSFPECKFMAHIYRAVQSRQHQPGFYDESHLPLRASM